MLQGPQGELRYGSVSGACPRAAPPEIHFKSIFEGVRAQHASMCTEKTALDRNVFCCSYLLLQRVIHVSFPDGLAAFRTFLKTEFSDENIEFWMACEEYKKIKSSTKLVSRANRIFNEFIDIQAPREVNIDYRTREKTKQSLEDPSPTSLNEVQAKIYSLMEKDSYPRFLRSKMYQDMVNRAHAQGQRRSV
ncbi:regulator of G-protein signaling 8-like [Notolabrus celidotus]|uniref:regulator of G-protein signaling 8-like n=1 Tax=Notolabrus celidotus TaxID=1203425 RepID=UPI00148FF8C2|nr:regulator of G-protein signaling 8-like [Notolabrus celidotus]